MKHCIDARVVLVPVFALLAGCAASRPPEPASSATPVPAVPAQAAAPRPIAAPQHPGDHPGSYSPTLAPPPWDAAAYQRDPAAYCAQVMPGRCLQVAAPAADVPLLATVGSQAFTTRVGGRVTLAARTEPGFPLSLTSYGLGAFVANGQTSITVPADSSGLAQAEWAATPGTLGAVKIVAGSPVRAGNATFLIHVQE